MARGVTSRSEGTARGALITLVLLLAGCSYVPDGHKVSLPIPKVTGEARRPPVAEREHVRILVSYGGVYENARLQSLIEKTLERLRAAPCAPAPKPRGTS